MLAVATLFAAACQEPDPANEERQAPAEEVAETESAQGPWSMRLRYYDADGSSALVYSLGPSDGSPVVMIPGLGLSAYLYLTTPDERAGWAELFAARDFRSHVFEPSNTTASGVGAGAVELSTWEPGEIWPRWGFGSAPGRPHDDVRFPVDAIDQFLASIPGRASARVDSSAAPSASAMGGSTMAGSATDRAGRASMDETPQTMQAAGSGRPVANGGARETGAASDAGRARSGRGSSGDRLALEALLDDVGPAVVIAHSMGGQTAIDLTRANPSKVRALVLIEPVGCPSSDEDIDGLGETPVYALYGDYIDERNQGGRLESCRATVAGLSQRGVPATLRSLPEENIHGNTHLLMQDDNSADLAEAVVEWIGTLP